MKKSFTKEELLTKLLELVDDKKDYLVLSLSKKGEFYAKNLALKKGFIESDFLFLEKVKSPINKETTIAVISETKDYILLEELIDSFDISKDFVFNELERVYEEKILQDLYKFRQGESIISLENKHVLLVDEVANTGITLLTAIKSAIEQNALTISVAIPLIAKETAEYIENFVDETFFVYEIDDFIEIDTYIKGE